MTAEQQICRPKLFNPDWLAHPNCLRRAEWLRLSLSWQARASRLVVFVIVFCAAFPLAAQGAHLDAEGGTITTRDTGGGPLQVMYYCERGGSDAQGYLHVKVSTVVRTSPRERNLEIVFYAHCPGCPSQASVAYHLPVRLPEGSTGVQAALPFFLTGGANNPNGAVSIFWDVSATEDGRDIELSRILNNTSPAAAIAPVPIKWDSSTTFHMAKRANLTNNILRLVDDTLPMPDVRAELGRLVLAGPNAVGNNAFSASIVSPTAFGLSQDASKLCSVRSLSTAPDQWQYYLQFNLVFTDRSALEKLRVKQPRIAQALSHFIAAGGSFLLIGDQTLTSRQTIDAWLMNRQQSPGESNKTWKGVHAQSFAWWWHDLSDTLSRAVVASNNSLGSQPNSTVVMPDGRVVTTYTPAGQYANQAQTYSALPATAQPMAMPGQLQNVQQFPAPMSLAERREAREFTVVKPGGTVGGSLLSGYARDGLVALETYAKAEYGNALDLTQEFSELFAENLPMAMSGMSGGVGMSVGITELQYWLEGKIVSIENQQLGGCATREHVLGHVAVVEPGLESFPVDQLRAVRSLLAYTAATGVNSSNDEAWSWRNLIPSVGRPPVWIFCTLVLLFGMLLGPGLLILTGYLRRRSLLIFLVPFISLVATVLIVTYEVLHEGFDTHIRISSVLAVDEHSGQSFAWSRQTYFSGWPPREGLKLPNQVYFRPVISDALDYQPRVSEPRRNVFSAITIGQSETIWKGWLRSREQQQLLIGHPANITAPLKVKRLDSKRVLIQNLSGHLLPFALLRDGADGLFLVEALAAGAEVVCASQTLEEAGGVIARYRAEYMPDLPDGLSGTRMMSRGRFVGVTADTSASQELMNQVWNKYLSEDFVMPKYGFVTIMPESSAVIVPLSGKVSDSQHLVVGRLLW